MRSYAATVATGIPVNPAIAPGQVDVQDPLSVRAHCLKEGRVHRQFGCAVGAEGDGDLVAERRKGTWFQPHEVVVRGYGIIRTDLLQRQPGRGPVKPPNETGRKSSELSWAMSTTILFVPSHTKGASSTRRKLS